MGVDVFNTLDISIHALRKESDIRAYDGQAWSIFQSTLSVRRATVAVAAPVNHMVISIHALRKESDLSDEAFVRSQLDFNPRSP